MNAQNPVPSPTPPPGWWKRNWKWALPSGCLLALLLTAGGIAGIVYGVMSLMKSSGAYQLAWKTIQADPRVQTALGEPLQEGWFVSGNIKIQNQNGQAALEFPVTGPKGRGTVTARAVKANGTWSLIFIKVTVEGRKDPLILIAPATQGVTSLPSSPQAPPLTKKSIVPND